MHSRRASATHRGTSLSLLPARSPFDSDGTIHGPSFFYGEGEEVRADSQEIKKRLGAGAPAGIETISRRIHVFFGDDQDRNYTTQALDIMQFLEGIEGALVFDPQQNKLLDPPRGE